MVCVCVCSRVRSCFDNVCLCTVMSASDLEKDMVSFCEDVQRCALVICIRLYELVYKFVCRLCNDLSLVFSVNPCGIVIFSFFISVGCTFYSCQNLYSFSWTSDDDCRSCEGLQVNSFQRGSLQLLAFFLGLSSSPGWVQDTPQKGLR